MGGDFSKECACSGMCAPTDVETDQKGPSVVAHGYQSHVAEAEQFIPDGHHTGYGATPGSASGSGVAPGWGSHDDSLGFFVPPPDEDEATGTGSKKAQHSAAAAGGRGAASSGSSKTGITLEAILSDLERAEQVVYGGAFQDLGRGTPHLQPDHPLLRDFLLTNSALTAEDLDTELLKIASTNDSFSIDTHGFLMLLRMNALSDSDALNQFMALTANGEDIASQDCRSGLLNLVQTKLHTNFSDSRSEQIFDAAMVHAGLTVSMEQWVMICKTVARIVRLARFAKI